MNSHDWIVVIITAAISVPIALLSPFGSDRIKDRLAGRSKRNAQRRSDELNKELASITYYHQYPQKFHAYLLGRILYVTLFAVGSQIVSGIEQIGIVLYLGGPALGAITSVANATFGLGVSVFLTAALLVGMRAYSVYRKVSDYDSYTASVHRELERLEKIDTPTGHVHTGPPLA